MIKFSHCPNCGSKRLKKLLRMHMYFCPRCGTKIFMKQEAIEMCYKCERDIVDTDVDGVFMGNGRYKHKRCRKVCKPT